MRSPVDVESALGGILKSFDRIGFGRRGVLDAEEEILRFAARLSPDEHARFRQIVLAWIEPAQAARVTARLHYNLPEHLQTLAIRLCASVPIRESLPLLRRLHAGGAFRADDERECLEALRDAVERLGSGGHDTAKGIVGKVVTE